MTNTAKKSQDVGPLDRLAKIVTEITGVVLENQQRSMVETRVSKRYMDLGLSNFDEYLQYFEQNKDSEQKFLVSLLTTHHTFFFRETSHFEFLEKFAIENAVKNARARGSKKIRIWSAACSRGQEVYSLAMHLSFHLPKIAPDMDFEILGTDVDHESVAIGKNGVYAFDEIKSVPMNYLGNHWARGKAEISNFVSAKPSLRNHVKFESGNLLKVPKFPDAEKFDIIFCRNVFIYFKPEQVLSSARALIENLHAGGIFIIGLSESITNMDLGLKSVAPSVYYKPDQTKPKTKVAAAVVPPIAAHKIRVVCVDDSPTILTLMKGILKSDFGFEIVGLAKNGVEAHSIIEKTKPDLVTCDIHMPEMDGITYLRTYMNPKHPPVIMVSSVSREDSNLAQECLKLGAQDYVEKPSVSNINERGEEIRMKLKSVFANRSKNGPSQIDTAFATKTETFKAENKVRIIVYPENKKADALNLQTGFQKNVPIYLVPSESIPLMTKQLKDQFTKNASIMVLGELGRKEWDFCKLWEKRNVLIQDLGQNHKYSFESTLANDRVPVTSFAYMSNQYFGKSS